jgi:hypothetical protein
MGKTIPTNKAAHGGVVPCWPKTKADTFRFANSGGIRGIERSGQNPAHFEEFPRRECVFLPRLSLFFLTQHSRVNDGSGPRLHDEVAQ